MLVSACPLLSVSRSASIEAACQSQRVVRTAFRAVSCVAHLLRNVCLSVFASQCVSVCLLATRVDLSYFASQRASVCLPFSTPGRLSLCPSAVDLPARMKCLFLCLSVCRPACLLACLPACLHAVCLAACFSACLSVCLSACMSVCLCACLSV